MLLPNGERAFIDNNKLVGYSLNFNHDEGKHKARVFRAALNLTIDNLDELRDALLEAVKVYEAIPDKASIHGQKYVVDFPMRRGDKIAVIHSVWMIRNNENFPRLITCYVL